MKNYEMMIRSHWDYIASVLMAHNVQAPIINECRNYYINGFSMGYVDSSDPNCTEDGSGYIKDLPDLAKFHFLTAYTHGFKHGIEDTKNNIFCK